MTGWLPNQRTIPPLETLTIPELQALHAGLQHDVESIQRQFALNRELTDDRTMQWRRRASAAMHHRTAELRAIKQQLHDRGADGVTLAFIRVRDLAARWAAAGHPGAHELRAAIEGDGPNRWPDAIMHAAGCEKFMAYQAGAGRYNTAACTCAAAEAPA